MRKKKICPRCGTVMEIDTSAICTSIPPKYRCVCPSCKYLDFIDTSDYYLYSEDNQLSFPKGLDEAASSFMPKSMGMMRLTNQPITEPGYSFFQMLKMFEAGAKWMAEQGVSVDGLFGIRGVESNNIVDAMLGGGLKMGDKVIVQIRKAE